MPDDDSSIGSGAVGIELAERIQLCWSPTAQLPREYGSEVPQDLFEQLLANQVRQAPRRGVRFPVGQYFAEVFDDEPVAGDGVHRFLIDVADGHCRVLPSLGGHESLETPGCLLTAIDPSG
jgi:hypothetical protein